MKRDVCAEITALESESDFESPSNTVHPSDNEHFK